MSQVIDMAVVEELVSLTDEGEPELLIDLIQLYLQDGPRKLAEIQTGLSKGDWDQVERAAHSLKGAAGNLGAILVQKDCETLQVASRDRKADLVRDGVKDLKGHYREAEAALQQILQKYT